MSGADVLHFFQNLCSNENVRVVQHPRKGKAVVAAMNITKGTNFVYERPLVMHQTVDNRSDVLSCHYCGRFIGSLELQCEFLCRRRSPAQLHQEFMTAGGVQPPAWSLPVLNGPSPVTTPDTQPNMNLLSDIVPCLQGCGEVYCSNQCREQAWNEGHELLCVGSIQEESHPLLLFKLHALETNEIFLLLGKIVAAIICAVRRGVDEKTAIAPYVGFIGGCWWDDVCYDETCGMSEESFRTEMKHVLQESIHHLSCAMAPHCPSSLASTILNLEFAGRVLALFERNLVSVVMPSPLRFYSQLWQEKHAASGAPHPLIPVITEIKNVIIREEGEEALSEIDNELVLLTPLDATGLFPLCCSMNHSCVPNAVLSYPETGTEPILATVQATRDIVAGEEISISYIDETEDYQSRCEALRDYCFSCDCWKCLSQQ
eukprot:GCRY01001598.1.p1 GENE.GCRY01001598.1~~GCRY01001598.1.p1  ORF type:complete len:430 (+),score=22.51 GCRY01001598.1:72-1361(+)